MHILCIVCVHAQLLSHSWLFVTAWTTPPGSSVHGIFWARILEWIATSYSRGSSRPRGQTQVSCVSGIGGWILCHCTTWEAIYCADMHTYMINKYRYIPHTHTHMHVFLLLTTDTDLLSIRRVHLWEKSLSIMNYPGYFKPDFSFLLCKERRGRRSVFSCDLNTVLFSKGVETGCDQWNSFHQPHWTTTVCLSLCLTSVVFLFEELIWLQM